MVICLVIALGAGLGISPHRGDAAPAPTARGLSPSAAAEAGSATVSADPLPTVQIDGVAFTQAVVGDVVYVGGRFATARPAGAAPGVDTVPRTNFLAYRLETGELVTTFAPSFNAQVRVVSASPDGRRLYVGGDFTEVDGRPRRYLAAFDVATGALLPFAPPVGYHIWTIAHSSTAVYVGGNFQAVGSRVRRNLAAFDSVTGAVLAWAPDAAGGPVAALAVSPDGAKVAVGGRFTSLNGSSSPGYGLGAVDGVTGASLPWPVNEVVRVAAPRNGISSLFSDGVHLYGSAYGSSQFEGVFSVSWADGSLRWIADCHGDTHSVFVNATAVYSASHAHNCANIGGFPETSPRTWKRALAFTLEPTRTVSPNAYAGYRDHGGLPGPDLHVWFPYIDAGTFTGQQQGPWHVTGNDRYVVMGGEFRRVDHRPQQGLVRFAVRAIAPNRMGPELFGAGWPLRAEVGADGSVALSWVANWDQDDGWLRYRVYRGSTLIHSVVVPSRFWDRPLLGMVDVAAPPGVHRYRVLATDAFGNPAVTPSVDVVVPPAVPPPGPAPDVPPTVPPTVPPPTVPPTVPPAPTVLVVDAFDREVMGGWGQAWTFTGRASRYSVTAGSGRIGPSSPGTGGAVQPVGVALAHAVVEARVAVDAAATGGGTYLGVVGRRVGQAEYCVQVRQLATGRVQVGLVRKVAGVETLLATAQPPGLLATPGRWLRVRVEVATSGVGTALSADVWPADDPRPPAPILRVADSTPELQGAGTVGLVAYVSASATSPVTAMFDDVMVTGR